MKKEFSMRRKIGCLVLLATVFILIEHFVYTHIAGYRIPIMDFYRWIANYAERVHSGSMRFIDFFSDTNEQVQPVALAMDFFVFEHTRYSMYALVVMGAVLRAAFAVGLAAWLYRRCEWTQTADLLFAAAVLVTLVMAALNENQWELYIEPFGMTCAIRVIAMFGLFALASKFIRRMLEYSFRQQVLYLLVLGCLSGVFSITLAGGSCVAFLGAISVAFLLECFASRRQMKPRYLILAILWAAAVLGSVAVYISFAGEGTTGLLKNGASLAAYFKGFLIYLGGAIVPQHYIEESVTRFVLGGALLLVVAVVTGVVYLKMKLEKRSYMPLLLMLYAAICGAVIVVSRVPLYGPGTMGSSRYSVESIVGLIGMLWAWLVIYPEIRKNAVVKTVLWVGIIGILLLSLRCMYDEFHWGFARRRYQDNLRAVIVEFRKHTDEELASSQSDPRHVRDACTFLEKNGFVPFEQQS